jgi:hypothetical protein
MKESDNIKFCFLNTENMYMNILIQDTSQTISNTMTEYNQIPAIRNRTFNSNITVLNQNYFQGNEQ